MDYLTHNDMFWLAASLPPGTFQRWVFGASLDDEFADGPLDAPVR